MLACLDRCEQELVYRHGERPLRPAETSASAHFGQMLHYGVRALYDGATVTDATAVMLTHWHDELTGRAVAATLGAVGSVDEIWACPTCTATMKMRLVAPGEKQGGRPNCLNCRTPMFLLVDPKKTWLGAHDAHRWLVLYRDAYLAPGFDNPPYSVVWNEGYAESATESGLPDRAVATADGLVWAMDLKTTGMYVGKDYLRSFEYSMQAAMQIDLLEAALQRPVAGFVLDLVTLGRKIPSAEGLRRYGPLPYSAALRDELRALRALKAQRIEELMEHPERAERRLGACVRYNTLCAYFDLCHADPGERAALVQIKLDRGDYTEAAWEPATRI